MDCTGLPWLGDGGTGRRLTRSARQVRSRMSCSSSKRPRVLRLKPCKLDQAIFELDGISHKEMLSLDERVGALDLAICRMERLTEEIATHAGSDEVAPFCWSFTPDWRRPSVLEGDFFWIYMAELAGMLRRKFNVSTLELERRCPDFLPAICEAEFGYEVLRREGSGGGAGWAPFRSLVGAIGELVDGARLVRAFFRHRQPAGCLLKNGSAMIDRILVKVPFEDPKVRYGDLLDSLGREFELVKHYIDVEHRRAVPSSYLRFLGFMSLGVAWRALRTSFSVVFRLWRMRGMPVFRPLAKSAYLHPRLNEVLLRALQYHCMAKALDSLAPVLVITVSNFDRATERMMAALTAERGIPCLFVLPHYLTDLRPSTRVLDFEVDRKRNPWAPLPSHMIALGEDSRNYLLQKGLEPHRVSLGGKSPPLPPANQADEDESTSSPSILLLLPNQRSESIALLEQLFAVREAMDGFQLFVRSHPRLVLGPEERDLAAGISQTWQDATGGDIYSALRPGMVTISLFSQAGLEAAMWGAGPIWLPNISENALTMMHLMPRIGSVCRNNDELRATLAQLRNPEHFREFARTCKSRAQEMFGVHQSISEAFRELSIPLGSRVAAT